MKEKKAKKKASRGFVIANVVLWSAAAIVVAWVMVQNRPGTISVPGATAGNRPVAAKVQPGQDPEEINYGTNILGKAPITAGIDGAKLLKQPKLSPEGFWIEDFYQASNGSLAEDLAAARAAGKILLVLWERPYCEYCQVLHTEYLRDPQLHAYVKDTFYTVPYDYYADKPIYRDFDGQVLSGVALARKHRVVGTPQLEFRVDGAKEVLRIPGLVEPTILLAAFQFADKEIWKNGLTINEWMVQEGYIGRAGRQAGEEER